MRWGAGYGAVRFTLCALHDKPLESNIFDEGHNYNETGLAY